MNALVINCSTPHYNLGAAKLADWLEADGHAVTRWDGDPGMFADGYDLVALSVIFSWHAPMARRIALQVREHADVWAFVLGPIGLLISLMLILRARSWRSGHACEPRHVRQFFAVDGAARAGTGDANVVHGAEPSHGRCQRATAGWRA